jgi:hypothetical protein
LIATLAKDGKNDDKESKKPGQTDPQTFRKSSSGMRHDLCFSFPKNDEARIAPKAWYIPIKALLKARKSYGIYRQPFLATSISTGNIKKYLVWRKIACRLSREPAPKRIFSLPFKPTTNRREKWRSDLKFTNVQSVATSLKLCTREQVLWSVAVKR